jgi:CubicO group peptidase (beta-lactamase class C family)
MDAASGWDERGVFDERVMRGFPVPPEWRVTARNAYQPPFAHWFMQHVREVERTASVPGGAPLTPLPGHPRDVADMTVRRGDGGVWTVGEALRATFTDGFLVLRRGELVAEEYFHGMRPESRHLWQSVTKSLGSCVAANLAEQGLLDPQAPVVDYVPELAPSAYGDARVRHLLDMAAGVRFSEDYADDDSEIARLDRLYGAREARAADEPGSSYDMAVGLVKEGEHGGLFHYVSLDVQVLGWVMERAAGASVPELISREVWGKLGTEHEAYIALDGAGSAQLEGGFCSSLRDLARFALMIAGDGEIAGRRVVPAAWIEDAATNGDAAAFAASESGGVYPCGSYRSNFWVSRAADHVAVMGLGIHGQDFYVNREAGVVAAKFSSWPVAYDEGLDAHEFALFESLAQQLA